MQMNCTGIVFGNRGTYLQSLVGWGFISSSVMLHQLVCQTELYCEQTFGSEKIYCNNTGFYFLYRQKN